MADDLFTVLVDSAADRTDEIAATGEHAKSTVDVRKVLELTETGDQVVANLTRLGVIMALSRARPLMVQASTQVETEAPALVKQDPTTIPAITDQHIAERKAQRIQEGS